MNEKPSKDVNKGDAPEQRDELMQSEKAANREQPKNFKDEAVTEKVVEVPPVESETPMKGLDPKSERQRATESNTVGARQRDDKIERE